MNGPHHRVVTGAANLTPHPALSAESRVPTYRVGPGTRFLTLAGESFRRITVPPPKPTTIRAQFQVDGCRSLWYARGIPPETLDFRPRVWYAGRIRSETPLKLAAVCDTLGGEPSFRGLYSVPRCAIMSRGTVKRHTRASKVTPPNDTTVSSGTARHSAAEYDMLVSHASWGGVRGAPPLVSGRHAEPPPYTTKIPQWAAAVKPGVTSAD